MVVVVVVVKTNLGDGWVGWYKVLFMRALPAQLIISIGNEVSGWASGKARPGEDEMR